MLEGCLERKRFLFNQNIKNLPVDTSSGLGERGTVGTICLSIPFILLSTKVVFESEIEKRYLTPFGFVDLTFRAELDTEKPKSHLIIEVGGDAEHWVSCDAHIKKSTTTLLRFVWGIAKDYLAQGVQSAFNEVSIDVKGYEMDLKAPWGDTVFGEWKALNENRPAAG